MRLWSPSRWLVVAAVMLLAVTAGWSQTPLKIVGVLGNTSGMSDLPFPYAYYTGIAADARGRLYFSGAAEGVPVSDQDGNAGRASRRHWRQEPDTAEDLCKQVSRHRDLCHLQDQPPGVTGQPRSDLDQFLAQGRQAPAGHLLG